MMKRIIKILLLLFIIQYCAAQQWPNIYGDYLRAHVRGSLEDYDKGYIIGGFLDNGNIPSKWLWLIKTDVNGEILWEKKFGFGR